MSDPSNVLWLTNFANYVHERPFILIVPATGRPAFVLPRLELDHVEHRVIGDVEFVTYAEFPAPAGKGWKDTLQALLPGEPVRIAVEPTLPLMISEAVGRVARSRNWSMICGRSKPNTKSPASPMPAGC